MKCGKYIAVIFNRFKFFIIFFAIGTLCVLIDFTVYSVLLKVGGQIFISKIISSAIAVSVNYLLNLHYNFNNKQQISASNYFGYLLVYSVLILINAALNSMLIAVTLTIQLSYWLSAVASALINYTAVKYYFRLINRKVR